VVRAGPVKEAIPLRALGARGRAMVELLRTNDMVMISWLVALLRGEEIEAVVFDTHTSVLEGSIGVLPRRLMVGSENLARARQILDVAGIEYDRCTKPV